MKTKRLFAIILTFTLLLGVLVLPSTAVEISQDSFELKAMSAVSVDGEADATVNVVFSANEGMTVIATEGKFSTEDKSGNSYITLTDYISPVTLSGTNYFDIDSGNVVYADANLEGYAVDAGGNVMTAVYTVDKKTPTGNYEVEFTVINVQEYEFNQVESVTYAATISVINTADGDDDEGNSGSETTTDPYTVGLKTEDSEVKVGDEITVDVLVGGTTGEFASSELKLNYEGLTFVSGSSKALEKDSAATITGENGIVKIVDYGKSYEWEANGSVVAYTLTFKVADLGEKASGTASVTIAENGAAFSTAENAATQDLSAATVTVAAKEFAVTPADLSVEMPEGFTSDAIDNKVEYDGTIIIEATNKNYIYTLTATGGTIIDNQDGTWTITNVTEDVTVTFVGEPVPKTYTITFNDLSHLKQVNGATPENSVVNFTYNPDATFSFVLKDNVPASTTSGMTYAVESISYAVGGNVTFAPPTTETDRTYTISGAGITGNIVITTSAQTVDPNQFTVTLPVGYDNELKANTTVVKNGDSVDLTLTPEAGYKYTVKYTMDGVEQTIWTNATTNETVTIENITANVTITVTKEFDETSIDVTVDKYLELDGSNIYLVTVVGNQKYSYDGAAMFYSAKYNNEQGAYVYLVKANANETLTAEAVLENIALTTDTAIVIDYTGDVNKTKKVDANDAQLVWNIYNDKLYSDFKELSMENFLRADVDGDGAVDMDDAAAIVTIIKTQN